MLKRLSLLLAALLFSCVSAYAQPRLQIAVDFVTGFPQGEFSDNVQNTGFGVSTEFFYRVQRSFLIGGTLGFVTLGSESRDVPFSPTIPDVLVQVDTSNNVLLSHFVARYQPGDYNRKFRPYAEGLIGLQYLWTQTSINGNGNDQFTSTNYSDAAFSPGVGGGADIRLYRGGWTGTAPMFGIDLNLGVRYLFGGDARYLTQGSIIRHDDYVTYLVSSSPTHLLTVNAGIAFAF